MSDDSIKGGSGISHSDQDPKLNSERRSQIMQVALKRFATGGFHATKISDIVAEVGVAQGTFYWYFKSKEAIALELIQEGQAKLLEVIAQGYRRQAGTIQDMVHASEDLLTRLFQFAEANRYLMEMMLGGTSASEAVRKAIGDTRIAMENAFVLNIQRAKELGMLPDTIDPQVRAAFLMSLLEGVISRWLFSSPLPGNGIQQMSAQKLASETARFEFFGLLGI